jgi:hypothetical protein
MRVIAYINVEDAGLIMTKKFVDELDKFFDKSDKILFVNTNGTTRFEVLPEQEKACCSAKPKPIKIKPEVEKVN